MGDNSKGRFFGLSVLCIVFVVGLILLNCKGEPCCPKIEFFKAKYKWLCKACDPVNRLFFKITYKTDGKKGCQFSGPGLMQLKNVTENKTYSTSNFKNTGTGVWENIPGGAMATVADDSTIKLIASGDNECAQPVDEKEIEVKVVRHFTVSSETLCFKYNDNPWPAGFWEGTTDIFGPGVVAFRVVNVNPWAVRFTHKGITTPQDIGPGMTSDIFQKTSPNGKWVISIPNKNFFNQAVDSGRELCVRIMLSCNCSIPD